MDIKIIPGNRVGEYKLGMTYHKLIKTIQLENIAYKKIVLPTCIKIVTKNMVFLLVNNVIMQITVYGDFKGTFNDTIGIGSSLADVKEYIGDIKTGEYDIVPTYELRDISGICFELKDEDNCDEYKVPIDAISIYYPQGFNLRLCCKHISMRVYQPEPNDLKYDVRRCEKCGSVYLFKNNKVVKVYKPEE